MLDENYFILFFVLIEDLLHLVNFISNNVLPHDANVLRICITLIHKLKAVDRKGYSICWSWKNTDVPLSTIWNGARRGRNDTTHTCRGRLRTRQQRRTWTSNQGTWTWFETRTVRCVLSSLVQNYYTWKLIPWPSAGWDALIHSRCPKTPRDATSKPGRFTPYQMCSAACINMESSG